MYDVLHVLGLAIILTTLVSGLILAADSAIGAKGD